jgi:hypothetical protein
MSAAMLRNASTPKPFAERSALVDLGLGVAQPGDVLVAIEGDAVGESLVVSAGTDDFVPSQQAATLRIADPITLDPWYLGAWLTTEPVREQLRRLARGLGIQRIPLTELGSLTVPVPPMHTQGEIGERYRAFETAFQVHRAVMACLADLRDVDLVTTFAAITEASG